MAESMNVVGLLCITVLVAPFAMIVAFLLRDRWVERRDRRIRDKCQRLADLFEEICGVDKALARAYLQSTGGSAYPYDLFMIEYRGGTHTVDTIWLPVRHFLTASDSQLKQILSQELAQPGPYTIPDWETILYAQLSRQKPTVAPSVHE